MAVTTGVGWRLRERASLSGGVVAHDHWGSGPPVVLVHGTPSWSYLWRNVIPILAKDFTVYAYDLLGYGDSEKRDDQDVSIANQARLLVELLDRWQLVSPGIVGHDIGGAIVLRAHLVEHHPFDRIALADAVVFNPWLTPTTMHIRSHLAAYQTMPAHIYAEVVSAHLRTAVFRGLTAETLAAYLQPWRGPAGQAAYFRKIAQVNEADTAVLEPLLRSVTVPALVLWGREDAWLSTRLADRLRQSIPGSRLRVIPEAGHFAMEDAPDAVAAELSRFFGEG
jgi:pimeloyl-ACP methyl ester carboxylesterase